MYPANSGRMTVRSEGWDGAVANAGGVAGQERGVAALAQVALGPGFGLRVGGEDGPAGLLHANARRVVPAVGRSYALGHGGVKRHDRHWAFRGVVWCGAGRSVGPCRSCGQWSVRM